MAEDGDDEKTSKFLIRCTGGPPHSPGALSAVADSMGLEPIIPKSSSPVLRPAARNPRRPFSRGPVGQHCFKNCCTLGPVIMLAILSYQSCS